ncbi:uncharacterized protein LOC107699913 [Tachysurus ichikawai]
MDNFGPASELCSLSDRVASWVEGTAASDDLHGLSCSADSAVSLDVIPESLKPEQSGSQGDQAKESNNAVSPDESCDSGSLLSETVHENRYILPSGVVEQPPGQRGMGVQTRTGRMVKPVNRLIENMTQSIKTLNQVDTLQVQDLFNQKYKEAGDAAQCNTTDTAERMSEAMDAEGTELEKQSSETATTVAIMMTADEDGGNLCCVCHVHFDDRKKNASKKWRSWSDTACGFKKNVS